MMSRKSVINFLKIFLFYTVFSSIFTWPTVLFNHQLFPTRQFDVYPLFWLIEEAPAAFPSLMHESSAWPYGEMLVRIDSYVLLLISWVNHSLLDTHTVATLFLWLGPVINAVFAEWCAFRGVGIVRPWSLLAGIFYGFSSIAACAILEGHLYYLFNPWLPLLLKVLWTSSEGKGNWRTGVIGGIWASFALFTSAYMGICAVLMGGWMWMRAPRRMLDTIAGICSIFIPAGMYYIFLFRMGGVWEGTEAFDPTQTLKGGTTTLLGLLSWGGLADSEWHSVVAPLAFSMFWLSGIALFLKHSPLRWLAGGAWVALFLSFGAHFQIWPNGPSIPTPLSLLSSIPAISFFRFPIRLLWVYTLLGGIVAASMMEQLSQGLRWRGLYQKSIFLIVLVESLGMAGMPMRLRQRWMSVPSAYEAAPMDAAVLDLMGEMVGASWARQNLPEVRGVSSYPRAEMAMRRRVLSCFYQATHKRPVLDVCIGTSGDSPREMVSTWLIPRLFLLKKHDHIAQKMAALGIGAIALHQDTFRHIDFIALQRSLVELFGTAVIATEDGGARVELYLVPNYERLRSTMIESFKEFQRNAP